MSVSSIRSNAFLRSFVLLVLLPVLSACSDSDSDQQSGQFIDSPVQGLGYAGVESPGVSGLTDANGFFTYEEDEGVRFFIGGIELGSVQGQRIVTPANLVSGDPTATINITRFLLTIDSDRNPNNGIQISPEMLAAAESFNATYGDFSGNGFEATDAATFAQRPQTGDAGVPRTLVTAAEAVAHNQCTAADLQDGQFDGDCGQGSSGNAPSGTTPTSVNSALQGSHDLIYCHYSAEVGPYTHGQSVSVSITSSTLSIPSNSLNLTNPYEKNGHKPEAIWLDQAGGYEYALSNNETAVFNEINLQKASGGFIGQMSKDAACTNTPPATGGGDSGSGDSGGGDTGGGDSGSGGSGGDAGGGDTGGGNSGIDECQPSEEAGRFDLCSLNGANGFFINGVNPVDSSGFSVSIPGDLNGDGLDDLLVASPGFDFENKGGAGRVYVIYGKTTPFSKVLELADIDGTNGFAINGAEAGDQSGWTVKPAGDVNGDDVSDIIIGAYGASPNDVDDAGKAYVVFGKASGFPAEVNLGSLSGADGFAMNGADEGAHAGSAVAGAGDINNDGYDDVIVGAYQTKN